MFDRLKEEFDTDPSKVIVLGTLAATAAAKLLNAVSAAQGRRAYSKQVNNTVKHYRSR